MGVKSWFAILKRTVREFRKNNLADWAAALTYYGILASFASYNKTYGALGGVIVFFVWLWISNIAVLLGAELNAELERDHSAI